ncbi:MAG: hypothetical protein KGI60_04815, partial [Patescibacteria group bacterium]|nr:hypothetical protein [Patescibacteria group bacterium]
IRNDAVVNKLIKEKSDSMSRNVEFKSDNKDNQGSNDAHSRSKSEAMRAHYGQSRHEDRNVQ